MALFLIMVIVLDFVVGFVALGIGRSFWAYFFLAFFLTPIIAFIVLLIKGKMTLEELLDKEDHIFYCPSCDRLYYSIEPCECASCGKRLLETTILKKEWESMSENVQNDYCEDFLNGLYLRHGVQNANHVSTNNSRADELKKYKELLDMGAITSEEYERQKANLLNM